MLDTLSERLGFFSRNRRNLYRFNDGDHLPSASSHPLSAKTSLLAWVASQGLPLPPETRVLLLTHCRVFGYIFNPVSFYFCLDAQDQPLCAVAEVGNTFGELKPFLLGPEHLETDGRFRRIVPKHFYVSPFFALDLAFDFKLRVPGEQLDIHIDDREGDRPVLLTALTGRRVPLTDANLARLTLKYPLVTLRVIILGGEACPPIVATRWCKPGRKIFLGLGNAASTFIAPELASTPRSIFTTCPESGTTEPSARIISRERFG